MRHYNVTFEPDGIRISIHAGATLLDAAGRAGIILNTICGGKGICKKCIVNLRRKPSPSGEPGSKPARFDSPASTAKRGERRARRVLACQYTIEGDVTVTIPPASKFFEQKILTEGTLTKTQCRPNIWEKYKDRNDKILGLAIDIGTTTVVIKLLDMKAGRLLATEAELNPQTQYGDDVISRIAYAQSTTKLAELHKAIINCINKLISQLCKQADTNPEHIYEVCVVGNTTMNHIFLGFPITQLGQAPYRAFSTEAHNRRPASTRLGEAGPDELKLSINPAGNIHTVENIAGFVGSDTTAAALAAGIDSANEMTLIVDIGTNGEIVLGTADELYAASCAAGPAFEGARISCGSRASEGAIEAVITGKDDIDLDVIGGQRSGVGARSICGSGLIDAVAVLLQLGIIDKTGRFVEIEKLKGRIPPAILSRIAEHNGQRAFVLAERRGTRGFAPRRASDERLLLTQEDIRQVQLAKAAIRTGIKLLQKKIGVSDNGIQHIYLAGAFGNYIRAESALRIGLLPNVPAERIKFIGNAACSGAQMILLSQDLRKKAGELARKIKHVEIAHEPHFADVFAESMTF